MIFLIKKMFSNRKKTELCIVILQKTYLNANLSYLNRQMIKNKKKPLVLVITKLKIVEDKRN